MPDPVAAKPSTPGRSFDRDRLFFIFFFAAYFFLIYQLLRVLAPFLAPLLGAVMLALAVYPVRQWIGRAVRPPTAAAFLTTALVMMTIVGPAAVLALILVRESAAAIPVVGEWLAAQQANGMSFGEGDFSASLDKLWATLSGYAAMIDLDLRRVTLEAVREIGNRVTVAGATMVREFFVLLFQLVILLLALFFFLRDGPSMIKRLLDLVPMENDSKTLVLQGLDRTLVAMVRGILVTAAAQGALTGVGLALFGVPYPVVLGFAATFLAVVPFLGAALVWVPAVVYLFLGDHTVAGIGLTLWGLLAVGLIDNVLRPMVVSEHAQLPITLLFLGVLGGFQVYGLVGGLLSPLLIASVFAFARIYRERYVEQLPRP